MMMLLACCLFHDPLLKLILNFAYINVIYIIVNEINKAILPIGSISKKSWLPCHWPMLFSEQIGFSQGALLPLPLKLSHNYCQFSVSVDRAF